MTDASAYHVGPVGDPDRFTLTHLLGSGGEGEVWRAVRTDGSRAVVAVKINRLPDDPAAAAAATRRLRELIGLRVDGLVQVFDVFDGAARRRADDPVPPAPSHQYVVMEYVEGVTLRTWLDENPASPPRRRLQVLRAVARTLSTLHDGPAGGAGLTHGDIKPANIIMRPDGRPVLVDLGLMRSVGSGPASGRTAAYSSPELRHPDATPTARTDTFSFAVTAMEVLTGLTPPLGADGHLDVGATDGRLRHLAELRRRPMLRRQLLRSLAVAPEERPATPARVFAARGLATALVPVLLLAGAGLGGAAVALGGPDGGPSYRAGSASPTGSPGDSGTTAEGEVGGIVEERSTRAAREELMSTSPTPVRRLPGRLLHAALTGGTPVTFREVDRCVEVSNPRPPVREDGATGWGDAGFDFTFTADRTVRVLEVREVRSRIPQPTRVHQWIRACGEIGGVTEPCDDKTGTAPIRTRASFRSDLDRGTFRELPSRDTRSFGVFAGECRVPSVLSLDTRNCTGSFALGVEVEYQVVGEPGTVYTQTFAGIRSHSRLVRGAFTTELVDGPAHTERGFTTGAPGCRGRGLVARTPYRSARREARELLVQAVRERRRQVGSRDEAIIQIARDLFLGSDLATVVGELTVLCDRAARESGWRGTCGPPDPAPGPPDVVPDEGTADP